MLSERKKERLLTEIRINASRSGGPGGQNVNKVNTKIELRFDVDASGALTENEKELVRLKLRNRITAEGEFLITSSTERSQWKNRKKAENKFLEQIEKALTIQKRRKKTLPTLSSKLKRADNKKLHAQKKARRQPPLL